MIALDQLNLLAEAGHIRDIDYYFARMLANGDSDAERLLLFTAAAACQVTGAGHVCLDLAAHQHMPLISGEKGDDFEVPDLASWIAELKTSAAVGDGQGLTPLVLEESRLYLHKYWSFEQRIAACLTNSAMGAMKIDPAAAELLFARDFGHVEAVEADQRLAVAMSCLSNLTVITGGPGTGKTTTVASIIRLHQSIVGARIRIALVAPTGKAASRLNESLGEQLADLDEATTIHRLLGWRPNQTEFKHHRDNPLLLDLLIVDEASMIDLPLMTRLFEAVDSECHVVLLGDKDQLSSVEAGSVFGDICATRSGAGYAANVAKALRQITALEVDEHEQMGAVGNRVVALRHNFRFSEQSGIADFAAALKRSDAAAVQDCLHAGNEQLQFLQLENSDFGPLLQQHYLANVRAIVGCDTLQQAWACYASMRLLCALRRGPLGADALNRSIQQIMQPEGPQNENMLFKGLPILITQNSYQSDLFNGDTALIWPNSSGRLQACFPGPGGNFRCLDLARLPDYTPAFALTVHQSQGSEFDRVVLLLSDRDSPVLSRELIYTGVTRARDGVLIVSDRAVFLRAIGRKVVRQSGLVQKLRRSQSPRA